MGQPPPSQLRGRNTLRRSTKRSHICLPFIGNRVTNLSGEKRTFSRFKRPLPKSAGALRRCRIEGLGVRVIRRADAISAKKKRGHCWMRFVRSSGRERSVKFRSGDSPIRRIHNSMEHANNLALKKVLSEGPTPGFCVGDRLQRKEEAGTPTERYARYPQPRRAVHHPVRVLLEKPTCKFVLRHLP